MCSDLCSVAYPILSKPISENLFDPTKVVRKVSFKLTESVALFLDPLAVLLVARMLCPIALINLFWFLLRLLDNVLMVTHLTRKVSR